MYIGIWFLFLQYSVTTAAAGGGCISDQTGDFLIATKSEVSGSEENACACVYILCVCVYQEGWVYYKTIDEKCACVRNELHTWLKKEQADIHTVFIESSQSLFDKEKERFEIVIVIW